MICRQKRGDGGRVRGMRRHYGNEDGEQRGKVKAGEVGEGEEGTGRILIDEVRRERLKERRGI